MTNGPLDPRIDMMVAALYGELSEDERERFEKLLSEDAALRAEWDELQGTRQALASWEVEETAPSFVLVDPKSSPAARESSEGSWGERVRSFFGQPGRLGWAVAAAATVLLVFSWLDFRVEFEDQGIAFRFGASQPEFAERADRVDRTQPTAWASDSLGTRIPLTGNFSTVANDSPYITRDEFHAYTQGVARALGDLIRAADYNRATTEEFSGYMRTVFQGLEDRQAESYYDLRGRIETIRYEAGRGSQQEFLESLPGGESLSPGVRSASETPADDDEGEGGR